MAKINSDEINFKQYVDGVKENKLSWNLFMAIIQDFSYSDINRLRHLNAILLTELTMNHSDMEKLKYLNQILLIQFKNRIERENDTEVSGEDNHEDLKESSVDQILNEDTSDETIQEVPTNEKDQILITETFDETMEEITTNENDQILSEETFDETITEMPKNENEQISNEENFDETAKEISTNEDDQMSIVNEIKENLIFPSEEEIIESNQSEISPKIFLCHVCNKEYNMYFHL